MAKIKPRVKVPKKAEAGEVITIKALISHPMESGRRKDKKTGKPIPRKIINRFTCDFVGASQSGNVIDVELHPAVSTNPYFQFEAKVPESGEFRFKWVEDGGAVYELAKKITVA